MASKEEQQLVDKLRELFQLDQPELDFGLYRIMHAKDEEVTDYLKNGLPNTLQEVLDDIDDEEVEERRREYEEELQEAKDFAEQFDEVKNPEEAESVQKAKKRLKAAKQSADADNKVYEHLYRFFSRYYEKGDFVTRRYRVRETDTQAAPYAIPYNGEEVKLHWANADQYYIKTAEHFRNFRFDLREAVEKTGGEDPLEFDLNGDEALPVHFRIVDGEEDEHDNVKDTGNKVRKLKPYTPDLLEVTDDGEFVVNFEVVFQKSQGEYIYDDEMEDRLEDEYGTSVGKGDKEPLAVAETVFDHLSKLEELDPAYKDLLRYVPPPNNKATPPLLAQYYEQFADKHEMDYFIHKDLGAFLRRELSFYIKNEVMRLDDIQRAEAPSVESYLDIVKALRLVGHDIIDFLSQLEDFQKKLWLKKKFVVDTGYCVTLDQVPDDLYDDILNNDDQLDEWRKLYAVEEWDDELFSQDYGDDVFTRDFLDDSPHMMIDTEHFGDGFTDRLLAHLGNQADGGITEAVDGLCVQSENFQATRLLGRTYAGKIKGVYIDPPYNTGNDRFPYKDNYRHSSWVSMMDDRIRYIRHILKEDGLFFCSIDENEGSHLKLISDNIFGERNLESTAYWRRRHNQPNDKTKPFAKVAESVVIYSKNSERLKEKDTFYGVPLSEKRKSEYSNRDNDPKGKWGSKPWKSGSSQGGTTYTIETPTGKKYTEEWLGTRETFESLKEEGKIYWPRDGDGLPRKKYYLQERKKEGQAAHNFWGNDRYGSNQEATARLTNLVEVSGSDIDNLHPKPVALIYNCLKVATDVGDVVADFFAGSGTTGEATIKLNQEDGGDRQYVLVEMSDYFDTVMLPRLRKVALSDEWSDGVPQSLDGQSHIIKYHRLESYEDTLNNLELNEDEDRQEILDQNKDLRRDYRLNYMLDVETSGSPSLLNIDEFTDPRQYHLKVKKPGSDASTPTSVDLLETFNYLLGLRVKQINMPETFTAEFHRPEDPELPQDERTRLEIDGEMRLDKDGDWWFRTVTGWVPSDPMNSDDSDWERILVIWRTLTGDRERDNAMLNTYVDGQRGDLLDVDRIYVNGSNNLASLRRQDEDWEVHLLEKEFMERMWDVQDV